LGYQSSGELALAHPDEDVWVYMLSGGFKCVDEAL
jgi:hypothetical protein